MDLRHFLFIELGFPCKIRHRMPLMIETKMQRWWWYNILFSGTGRKIVNDDESKNATVVELFSQYISRVETGAITRLGLKSIAVCLQGTLCSHHRYRYGIILDICTHYSSIVPCFVTKSQGEAIETWPNKHSIWSTPPCLFISFASQRLVTPCESQIGQEFKALGCQAWHEFVRAIQPVV